MTSTKKKSSKKIVAPPTRFYRNISFSFIGVVVALLAAVLYFSLTSVTVFVKPKREALVGAFTVDVVQNPQVAGEVRGLVIEDIMEKSEIFTLSGEGGTIIPTAASGRVTIINNTYRAQTLVRTTRFLSQGGILFRLRDSVLVPAHGQVEADIYADEPGKSGEIEPTNFTIPGLWVGLQDKIYATSSDSMCCGERMVRVLNEDDITRAETELGQEIVEDVKSDLRNEALDAVGLGGELFLSETVNRDVDARVGEERTDFTLSLKIKVTGVFYDRETVISMARENIQNLAGEERELVELDPERVNVTVERKDAALDNARLNVEASGLLALRPDSIILRKERLFGLDRSALEAYFRSFSSVDSVRIEFRPPWIDSVPRLKDHIEIKIEE